MNRRHLLPACLLVLTPVAPAGAQDARTLLARGVAAYQRLALAEATSLLTAALTGADGLSAAEHARALAYLGASEVERGRQEEGRRAFRDLLLAAPATRLDPLQFSNAVIRIFDEVRGTTKAVAVDVTGGAVLRFGLRPTSPHPVAVLVLDSADEVVQTLFAGGLASDTTLAWSGQLPDGAPVVPGRYALVVASRADAETVLRHVRVPLDVARQTPDTLPHPVLPDTALVPEYRPGDPAVLPLAAGLLGGAATVLVPRLIGTDEGVGGLRFVVGASVGLAGIAGFLVGRRPEPIPASIETNRAVRADWLAEVRRIETENRARLARPTLRFRAGNPVRREGSWR